MKQRAHVTQGLPRARSEGNNESVEYPESRFEWHNAKVFVSAQSNVIESHMEFTRFTLVHVIWLAALTAGAVVGAKLGGSYFGIAGAVTGGMVGLVVGHAIFAVVMGYCDKRFFKSLSRSSEAQLRSIVAADEWGLNHTMALLELAARGADVRVELPRIVAMLESDSELTRRYGWDAVRLVFVKELDLMREYDPRGSTEDCRRRVGILKATAQEA